MAGQTDIVVTEVLARIEDGRLNPGDEIEEQGLMADCGVSRTPMREALLKLEAQGLVRRLPRKGATVFRPGLEEFLAILEVHAKLEGQAAGLAARRLNRTHGAAIEAAVAACEVHAEREGDGGSDRYYTLNKDFHARVAEAATNPFLLDLIKTNARKLMAYYRARYRYKGAIAASAAEHRAILTLILDRDAEGAEARMAAHVQFDQVTAMDLLAALT